MTGNINDFQLAISKRTRQYLHAGYLPLANELTAIANALSIDTTTHDTTMEAPPPVLRIGADKTSFTNDVLVVVNKGKGAGLLATDMANSISSLAGPPIIITAPTISGTGTVGRNLTSNNGTWQHFPTSYAYQWKRAGSNIAGATNAVYALVGADQSNTVTCTVTATNSQGSASSTSNGIAVT